MPEVPASAHSPGAFVAFIVLILALLALDLGLMRTGNRQQSLKGSLIWSAFWIGLAAAFNVFVWWEFGKDAALQFSAGYLLEEALSVDNVFVFSVIFTFFAVPAAWQQRVLFWGILGALVLRGVFIGLGSALIHRFEWVLYIFGVVLIATGLKLLRTGDDDDFDPSRNLLVRLSRRFVRVTDTYVGDRFLARDALGWAVTPLFLVLLTIETSDVLFALDSVPAVFSVTNDPFIIYSSNIFAILGLRSLYFLVQGAVDRFHYLKPGLAFILIFIGGKMLVDHWIKTPIYVSLGVIISLLFVSIGASWWRPLPVRDPTPPPPVLE